MRKLVLAASMIGAICLSSANYALAKDAVVPQRQSHFVCGLFGGSNSSCKDLCQELGAGGILGSLCL